MKANKILKNYYLSIPAASRRRFSKDLMQWCQVTSDVVYNWRTGRTAITSEMQSKINALVDRKLFENSTNSTK